MAGNNTVDVIGAYGTKSVPSVNNYPGGRRWHSMVFHSAMNCLFVFGGYGRPASATFGTFPAISLESFKFI